MQSPTTTASSHRERLLDRFFALGRHPRLLLYLRGSTEDEEWASLEILLDTPLDDLDLDEVFRGGWRRWWNVPPPTR